jgi:hypothetical protein
MSMSMSMLTPNRQSWLKPIDFSHDRKGDGRGKGLKRNNGDNPFIDDDNNNKKLIDIEKQHDARMRFNNAEDPIYAVFDYIDSKPIKELAKDFAKDTFSDIMNFVSLAKPQV